MPSSLIDPDQWYEAYETASVKQRYDMILELIDRPLSPELIEEMDLGMVLVEMRDELASNNLIDQAIAFIEKLQQQQPELYKQEYPYFNNFLVKYYLYRNEPEQVQASLEQFKADPVTGIDQISEVLDDLKFYCATDVAVDLCSATYNRVLTSPEVLWGSEELADIILIALIENAYQQIKRGETVDWDKFVAEAAKYGAVNAQDWLTQLRSDLTAEVEDNQQFFADFKRKKSRDTAIRTLAMAFGKYMSEQKQVSFICSQAIWEAIFDFLEERKLSNQKRGNPDIYFAFPQKSLDRYVAKKIGGFMSMRQSMGFAILWGLPYLYDFLLSKQVIGEEVHQQAIAAATELKAQLIEGFNRLWRYDFVHRWLPPDSVSEADFAAEADLFAASIEKVTPLSEEPGKGTLESLYNQLAEKTFSGEMFRLGDRDGAEETIDVEAEEIVKEEAPPLKPPKPPKSKKSPLKLAAELYAKGDKKPPQKKKKK